MDVTGPEIRLEPAGSFLFEQTDWSRIPYDGWPLMHHEPTHTIFMLYPDPAAMTPEGTFDANHTVAQLVHVCDGHAVPSVAEQVDLGRAAIGVFLIVNGWWTGTIE